MVQAGNIPCRRNLEKFSVGFALQGKQGLCLNMKGRVKNKTCMLKTVSVFNLVNDN